MKKLFPFLAAAALLLSCESPQPVVTVVYPSAIALDQHKLTLEVGKTQELHVEFTPDYVTDKTLTWSSSDPSVAVVAQNGVVKGVSPGNAFILVKCEPAADICEVAVTDDAPISIDDTPISIDIDGNFEDWNRLRQDQVSVAACASEARYTALKKLKVCANKEYCYIYFQFDRDQIYWEPDVEHVPIELFFNSDGNDATGGFADFWSDACSDLLFEGFMTDGTDLASFEPFCYPWSGETHGSGWAWGEIILNPDSGIGSGAGSGDEYEIRLVRNLFPQGGLAEEFSVGVALLQAWSAVGLLPNASCSDDNPSGVVPSLRVRTTE